MSMKTIKFNKNFLWGSAFSAPQTEANGINDNDGCDTIWEHWYKLERGRFFDEKFTLNNFKDNYKDDLKIAANLGMNSLRSSISWSKIYPNKDEISEKAIKFYRDIFKEYKKNNLKVFMNLYHFDMPMWAHDMGGWTSREVVYEYVKFAKTCFEKFGDLVECWFTFNEPIVAIECQYLYGHHYPNLCDFDLAMKALWNTNLAHTLAVNEFRKFNFKSEIGIILNITPAIPRSNSKKDLEASEMAELFQWKSYLDTIVYGKFPEKLISKLKERKIWPKNLDSLEDRNIFRTNKIDILGVNYYSPLRVKALDYLPDWLGQVTPRHFFDNYEMPYARINKYRGWEIYPKALYQMLKTLKSEYGNIKHFVSENGMGVQNEEKFIKEGIINDSYRISFLKEHIYWMHKAIGEGANCIGYHMWTYIDNWSWANAYKNRYGLVSLDVDTGERTLKQSAKWFKKVSESNEMNFEKKEIVDEIW